MTAPLLERLEAAKYFITIVNAGVDGGDPWKAECQKHIATLTEALAALADREKSPADEVLSGWVDEACGIDAAIKEGK